MLPLKHPFIALVVGPTSCGKTQFVFKLIDKKTIKQRLSWWDKELGVQFKTSQYISTLMDFFSYGAQTWSVTKIKLATAHHRCLRRLLNTRQKDKIHMQKWEEVRPVSAVRHTARYIEDNGIYSGVTWDELMRLVVSLLYNLCFVNFIINEHDADADLSYNYRHTDREEWRNWTEWRAYL